MKKKFSKKWIGSKQPRKQRKYRANAPLHLRHKLMSASLSKELRKKYGKRSTPLRKSDSVKVMVGEFKKKIGKIEIVDLKKIRVSLEGINRTKKDGTKVNVWFAPSNLQIQELNLEDKKRRIKIKEAEKEIKKETTKTQTKESVEKAEKITKDKTEQEEKK